MYYYVVDTDNKVLARLSGPAVVVADDRVFNVDDFWVPSEVEADPHFE